MATTDKENLHAFLWDSYTTVKRMLDVDTLFTDMAPPILIQAKKAWERASVTVIDVKEKLLSDSGNYDEGLRKVGLTGDDLRFKLNVFSSLRVRFDDLEKSIVARIIPRIHVLRGVARRLLDVIDTVLDSLTGVFPPLEAVTEVKDTIEAMVAA